MGGRKSIIEELKAFKDSAGQDMPITKMILFGSRAEGKTGRDTDVDLIVVSPKFRDLDVFKRGAKMYDYWTLRLPVDFLCYTPQEFNRLKKRVSIVSEALKNGIEIN